MICDPYGPGSTVWHACDSQINSKSLTRVKVYHLHVFCIASLHIQAILNHLNERTRIVFCAHSRCCIRTQKITWFLQRRMLAQLSILPRQCSLFITIIKNNQSNIWKKHTAPFKYVVKSVPLSVITVTPWSYAKHFVLRGYWNVTEVSLHKR